MSAAPSSRRPSVVARWAMIGVLAAGIASHNAIAAWQESHSFMINASDSLPNWAFFVSAGKQPAKGDYVFFVPPPGELVNRHFGPDQGPFGKQVIGMPGALVEHRGDFVFVDGVKVARIKPRTRLGEPLHPGPTGRVPRDCFYVGTDHPDGFDSRYAEIGFTCRKAILGTGTPIL